MRLVRHFNGMRLNARAMNINQGGIDRGQRKKKWRRIPIPRIRRHLRLLGELVRADYQAGQTERPVHEPSV